MADASLGVLALAHQCIEVARQAMQKLRTQHREIATALAHYSLGFVFSKLVQVLQLCKLLNLLMKVIRLTGCFF